MQIYTYRLVELATRSSYKNDGAWSQAGAQSGMLISLVWWLWARGWLIITTITDARSFLHGMEAITKH